MSSYSTGCFSFRYHPKRKVCYRRLTFLGYPHYRVGDDGSVWSIWNVRGNKGWTKLKWIAGTRKIGRKEWTYPSVNLSDGGTSKLFLVHFLVLSAFTGSRPPGTMARHFPDRNPYNVGLENLRWGTSKENQRDRIDHGTDDRGERCYRATITDDAVRLIRRLAPSMRVYGRYPKLVRILKRKMGIRTNSNVVRGVIQGTTWGHVK